MLLSASGGDVMASANDLIVLFLGLEILSIAALRARGHAPAQASSRRRPAIKYFVLGGFSSAFFLYGIALVYGATGSTNLVDDRRSSSPTTCCSRTGCCSPASRCCSSGSASRWRRCRSTPGRPTCTRARRRRSPAFMASAVKAAGFAGLLRVFVVAFATYRFDWQPIVYAARRAQLLVGSVLAVVQTDVKRMLAYSSISHAGFILVGVQAASAQGTAGGALLPARPTRSWCAGSFGIVTARRPRGRRQPRLSTTTAGCRAGGPLLALAFTRVPARPGRRAAHRRASSPSST